MRKLILTLLTLLSTLTAQSQLVRWVVPPMYDAVRASDDAQYFVADSADRCILYSAEGKCLMRTNNELHAFRQNRAVLTRRGSKTLTGICLPGGDVRSLNRGNVLNDFPYYSEGILIVHDVDRCVFYTLDTKKTFTNHLVANARPFSAGLSACLTYGKFDNQKDPYYYYLMASGDVAAVKLNGKKLGKQDLQYASSVGGEGFSIVVFKNKVYRMTLPERELQPLLAQGDVVISGKIDKALQNAPDGSATLAAQGPQGAMTLHFDNTGVPTQVVMGAETLRYTTPQSSLSQQTPSPISITEGDMCYGISIDGQDILPPQFEALGTPDGLSITAQKNGQWGMLLADTDPSHNLEVSINGGADLYFTGGAMKTFATLKLPVFLEVNDATDFTIDSKSVKTNRSTREAANTPLGNYVEYDVTISSTKSNAASFPVSITYDGLRLNPITVSNKVTKVKPTIIQQRSNKADGPSGSKGSNTTPTTPKKKIDL
ncbi:MAG: hypothetical protein KBT12_03045 [Bacteroidales bacterium]|nr:hypothetical protein [Candidatus Physcousia equi]